jgi:lambda family phage portal protein
VKKRQTLLQKILSPVATLLTGFVGGGYTATDPRRKLISGSTISANRASANTLLSSSLPVLRSHCRHLERNNPTARAAIEALVGLVVGSGIALEPDTGNPDADARIREVFNSWIETIGVDGSSIYQLQALALRELPPAGEAIWRIVPGPGPIPMRVLALESEWLSDTDASAPAAGCSLAAGIELDRYGQPVSYYLAPPERGKSEKVDASNIIHVFERRRPLQARGEPWLSPVIETLMNERDLVDAELLAAKQTASMALVITSESHDNLDTTEDGDAEDPAQSLRVGGVARMYPGESVSAFSHTRPSQQIAPFRQMLRGDIAAALRIPQRFLDRDVSRANYSSMRADMLDTERLLAPVREWLGHQTIGRLYRQAAPILSAVAGFRVDPSKYRLLPDGQPYVDPAKDAAAAVAAIAGGLSTLEAEISKRGGDWKQVAAQRQAESIELARSEIARLVEIQKEVNAANEAAPGLNLNWAQVATIGGAATAPGAYLAAATGSQAQVAPPDDGDATVEPAAPAAPAEDPTDIGDGRDRDGLLVARQVLMQALRPPRI